MGFRDFELVIFKMKIKEVFFLNETLLRRGHRNLYKPNL